MPFDMHSLGLKDTIFDTLKGFGNISSPTGGDIGLELEAEGHVGPMMTPYWKSVPDGSLRNNGVEYIFKKPLSLDATKSALEEFELNSSGWTFNDSPRTSCHVHINVQPFTFGEVYAVVGAYWLFEDILVEMCGKHRVGNLFCLRASDATSVVDAVTNSIKRTLTTYGQHFIMDFASDHFKYAALNLAALARFGSIEFRSMRGIYKKKDILPWVKLLHTLVHNAKAMGSPTKVYQVFKDASPSGLVEAFFGDAASVIKEQPGWQDSIKKSSMFLAQLAFVMNKAERGEFTRPVKRSESIPGTRFRSTPLTLSTNDLNSLSNNVPTPAWASISYQQLNVLKSKVILNFDAAEPGTILIEGEQLANPWDVVSLQQEFSASDY